jgi:hypothetical protein
VTGWLSASPLTLSFGAAKHPPALGCAGNPAVRRPVFRHYGGMLDLADYELVWPPELFIAEAGRIAVRPRLGQEAVDLLLREAFRDDSAAEDISSLTGGSPFGSARVSPPAADVMTELAASAHLIRRAAAPRPYWPQRHGHRQLGPYLDQPGARRAFADLIRELEETGYLDQAFPRLCVDGSDQSALDPAVELERRLGIPGLWPLEPDGWSDDTFYGLIEAYHDLVSRPRTRSYHDYANCGWHYSHYATTTGRELYRWRVNELLRSAGIGYQLADAGEDQGRLTEIFDDGRSRLAADAPRHAQPGTAARVQHAIALFRGRAATAEDKRSALIALAGILEERRSLIKAELTSADEGALFQIANKFAIRHRNDHQLADYDPVFLDWVFWWYLGTVELTSRIISRQQDQDSQAHGQSAGK